MMVVYGYNAANHSLGVALHSGSGGLCCGRKLQGLHEVGSQVPEFQLWFAEFPLMWEAAS